MVYTRNPLLLKEIRSLAVRCGFGHSIDLVPVAPGSKREAYYVSKYVSKATDQRAEVPWWGEYLDHVDQVTGEMVYEHGLVDGRYRTWSMSRGWGLTMSAVRAEAREFVNARESLLQQGIPAITVADVEFLFDYDCDVAESPPPPL